MCGPFVQRCTGTDDTLASFDRDPLTGALTYLGCLTGSEATGPSGSGACTQLPHAPTGSGLGGLESVVLSPDGKSVYTVAYSDAAVAWFDRNPDTSALTFRGCITGRPEAGPGQGACEEFVPALASSPVSSVETAVLSSDGTSLYVAAEYTIFRFEASPSTGALEYKDCITGDSQLGPSGSGLCAAIPSATGGGIDSGLGAMRNLALSPDGRSLYAASHFDDAIALFDRDPTSGRLHYAGCLTGGDTVGPSGSGACQEIQGQHTGSSGALAVSPNGRTLYVGANGISRFKRDPATGALTYLDCVGAYHVPGCRVLRDAPPFISLGTLSADGKSIYSAGDAISQLVVAPQTRITASPPRWTSASDATFRFRSASAAAFECRLDGESFAPCGSPRTYSGLPSGEHAFAVRARSDRATDPTPARSVFTVDPKAPRTRITRGPHGRVHGRRAVFRFRADEPVQFECRLGGRHVPHRLRNWAACGPAVFKSRGREVYKDLRHGKKIFRVRATDRAGNVEASPSRRLWRVA